MIFWMHSKIFRDVFLNHEDDNDILEAQYVIASSRIVRKDTSLDNIIVGRNYFFPDSDVCMAVEDDTFRERYFNQLMKTEAFLATIIKGSIEEGYNIIFINTKSEEKNMHYLQYLSEFIYLHFHYPCYNYDTYASGACRLLKYNKDKVIKKCDEILEKAQEKDLQRKLSDPTKRKEVMKDYKLLKKKELKEILKSRDLYSKGMDKAEMLEMLELFM